MSSSDSPTLPSSPPSSPLLWLEQNLKQVLRILGQRTATALPAGILASLLTPAETQGEVSPEQAFRLNVISKWRDTVQLIRVHVKVPFSQTLESPQHPCMSTAPYPGGKLDKRAYEQAGKTHRPSVQILSPSSELTDTAAFALDKNSSPKAQLPIKSSSSLTSQGGGLWPVLAPHRRAVRLVCRIPPRAQAPCRPAQEVV